MSFDDATLAQIRAADPLASTWVSANAGSGKTRVLTDRVARLLLQGTHPQKILCLTYTKAAAAEMQNRLFARLGEWAMMQDRDLRDALTQLGENPKYLASETLRTARTLFANALETPGGLKIQTIHSFCDKLLRRFPLEAGVSPQFEALEDRQAKLLRAEVLESLADGENVEGVDGLAKFAGGGEIDALLQEIVQKKESALRPVEYAAFGISESDSLTRLQSELLSDENKALLKSAREMMTEGSITDVKNAIAIQSALEKTDIAEQMMSLESVFLFKTSKEFGPYSAKIDKVPTKKTRDIAPETFEGLNAFMSLVELTRKKRVGLLAYDRARALNRFARAFLAAYERRKAAAGKLDFDDLIARANGLLSDSDSAQWVLYKLDGGIDHILVDEAQDTSPEQWQVIANLAEEFTAGEGSSEVERTIFVVGDEKQSIYSFQGADPAEFGRMRSQFDEKFQRVDRHLAQQDLLFSFRSADPVLRLVDTVFDGTAGDGLRGDIRHRPFKSEMPGRVDVWPFIESSQDKEQTHWFEPVDTPSPGDPKSELAKQVADWVSARLNAGTELPGTLPRRAMTAGDVLILVQSRGSLFENIIKELKANDVSVAGADRLDVGQELAVRDVLSFLKFVDLPEDDLSLAEALRSPLLGLSEGQLFSLAYDRKGTLWQSLRERKDQFPETLEMIWSVLRQTDYLRPYELIELILTDLKGRENLTARLGPEIEDGLNELLSQALRYEQLETPTLPGFLYWFQSGNVTIKREMDSSLDQVRVMTVHGAKGLEAPVVVLPDTARRQTPERDQIVKLPDGSAVWKTDAANATEAQTLAIDARKQFQQQERMRLLYVALTRAESWLVVCGAGKLSKSGDSWYQLVSEAANTLAFTETEIEGVGEARSLLFNWSEDSFARETASQSTLAMPNWMKTRAETPERPEQAVSPSKLEGAKALGSDKGLSEEDAMRKGRQVHSLLEHLPVVSTSDRHELARSLLVGEDAPETETEFQSVLEEATGILDDPKLAFLFTDDTLEEVRITAVLPELGDQRIDGFIDRLVVTDSSVLAVDFKTNAVPPNTAEETPLGILRQLGAYGAALEQIYPDRSIETAVLWAANRDLMSIPHDIVMNALRSTATS